MGKKSTLSKYLSELGKKGAHARMTKITPARRKAIATKASKAAAKARSAKARKANLDAS